MLMTSSAKTQTSHFSLDLRVLGAYTFYHSLLNSAKCIGALHGERCVLRLYRLMIKKSALSEERRKTRISFVARLWKLSWIVVVAVGTGAECHCSFQCKYQNRFFFFYHSSLLFLPREHRRASNEFHCSVSAHLRSTVSVSELYRNCRRTAAAQFSFPLNKRKCLN